MRLLSALLIMNMILFDVPQAYLLHNGIPVQPAGNSLDKGVMKQMCYRQRVIAPSVGDVIEVYTPSYWYFLELRY